MTTDTKMKLLPITTIAFVAFVVLSGWAFITLWAWFVVPLFQVPVLTLPHGVGLVLLARVLTWVNVTEEVETPLDYVDACLKRLLIPPCIVLLAWPISAFV